MNLTNILNFITNVFGVLTICMSTELAINLDNIEHINSIVDLPWNAGINEFMRNKTVDDIQKLCGTYIPDKYEIPDVIDNNIDFSLSTDVEIPKEFDVRIKWDKYIHPIRNQERCGSCWAFSAAEVLTDRFTIATKGKDRTVLSPEDLVSCDKSDMGCEGGQLASAWKYIKDIGIVSDKCYPYNSGNGTTTSCVQHCVDSEQWSQSKHHAQSYYKLNNVRDAQKEILANGPIQAAFRVYKSFMSYKSGVYQRNWWKLWDSILGGHAVKIIGWGTDHNNNVSVDYWLVANSWDTTWGEDGYFKIKRGVNMCGIESNLYAGLPDYSI